MEQQMVLEAKDITMTFPGVKALDNVKLDLRAGEVLGLIGENGAGKSTLMNILLGTYTPVTGTMHLKGSAYTPRSPHDALRSGISMIHQEISLIHSMSIAENIWLGRETKFTRGGIIDNKARLEATKVLLEEIELDLDPDALVETLPIAAMQLVEVARAISYESDVVIMDEPTSALTDVEVGKLYNIIRKLSAKGKSVIYISHKLEELFDICHRVTVFRDGKYVTTKKTEELDKDQLVSLMVGRDVTNLYPKEDVKIGDVVFECRNLERKGSFKNVSFSVHAGEILGFCGLIGAQRTEIMQAIFGLDKMDAGQMFLNGEEIVNRSPRQAIANHIALVTEDRLRTGGIHMLSVKTNLSLAYLRKLCKFGFVDQKQETEDYDRMASAMNIKVSSPGQALSSLSGGNQQKVIIGKWLLTEPSVLILDEPTRGVDVGAKAEIYKLIGQLAKQGKAIIMISSELPELMGISDRIHVVKEGEIAAYVNREDFDQDRLMSYAFGVNEERGTKNEPK